MLNRIKQWLTPDGQRTDGVPADSPGVVVTLPAGTTTVVDRLGKSRTTERVFQELIAEAREVVKVFSPYVDPTFTGLTCVASVPIRIVTTVREGRIKSNPVLERCSQNRPVSVRYLYEKKSGSQMYQLHAKMILCDRRAAYVGSANFTDTSLRYNLELGLYIEDLAVIDDLHRLFDHVFDQVAQPSRG